MTEEGLISSVYYINRWSSLWSWMIKAKRSVCSHRKRLFEDDGIMWLWESRSFKIRMLSLICLWMGLLIHKDRCGSISKLRMWVLHVENLKESQDLKVFLGISSFMQKLLLTMVSMSSINSDFNPSKTVDSKTGSLKKLTKTNQKQNGQQKQELKQQL